MYSCNSSLFSIVEDEYPILLINGKKIAKTILEIVHKEGHASVVSYLEEIDAQYESMRKARRPEELLLE